MEKTYGAITIGPVIETISQVSTPGALWCASGMFSWLTGYLCENILSSPTFTDANIIVPYSPSGYRNTDGIGRWHDRIFFSCSLSEEALAAELKTLCDNAKKELAKNICKAINFKEIDDDTAFEKSDEYKYLRDYIQLSWLTAPEAAAHAKKRDDEKQEEKEQNCILNLSYILDSLELNAGFPPNETDSPITRLFNGTKNGENAYVRECWLMPKYRKDIQLLKSDHNIREIEDVANPKNLDDGMKKRKYFAVVQSDGDNIGEVLKQIPSDEEVKDFSQKCIEYAYEAAMAIGNYGGLTIYAGGDDLLFLAPIEGNDGSSILSLCGEITRIFDEKFGEYKENCENPPNLSFGISINYIKHPLYEALNDALSLLFVDAKEIMKDKKERKKNLIALAVHKNSGESVKLLLHNNMTDNNSLAKKLDELIEDHVAGGDDLLHSILYTINTFRSSFSFCMEQELDTKHLFDNLFDSDIHNKARDYIDKVKELGDVIVQDDRCRAARKNEVYSKEHSDIMTDDYVDILCSMLRFAKLYTERSDT